MPVPSSTSTSGNENNVVPIKDRILILALKLVIVPTSTLKLRVRIIRLTSGSIASAIQKDPIIAPDSILRVPHLLVNPPSHSFTQDVLLHVVDSSPDVFSPAEDMAAAFSAVTIHVAADVVAVFNAVLISVKTTSIRIMPLPNPGTTTTTHDPVTTATRIFMSMTLPIRVIMTPIFRPFLMSRTPKINKINRATRVHKLIRIRRTTNLKKKPTTTTTCTSLTTFNFVTD